jgi:lambda family phage tail tape measure protein
MAAGELLVKLAMDMADFSAGMTRASNQIDKFNDRIQNAASRLATLATTGTFAMLVRGVVEARSRLDDLSETTSLAVETLSSLERTAFIGGHSLETVASGASKFAKSVSEATGGNKKLLDSFDALGISLNDLKTKRFDEIYVEFAKKIAMAEDKQNAIAHATRLAGKAAAESIPFWKDLADGGLEAAKVTAQQAAEAEKLEKETRKLLLVFRDVKDALIGELIPGMTRWIEANREAVRIAGNLGNALRLFVFNTEAMTSETPAEQIARLTKRLGELEEQAKKPAWRRLFSEGFAPQNIAEQLDIERKIDDVKKQLQFLKFLNRQLVTDSDLGPLDQGSGVPAASGGFRVRPPSADADSLIKRQIAALQQMEERKRALFNLNEQELMQLRITTGTYKDFDKATKNRLMLMAGEIDHRRELIERIDAQAESFKPLIQAYEQIGELQKQSFLADKQSIEDMEFQLGLVGKLAHEQQRLAIARQIDLEARERIRRAGDIYGDDEAGLAAAIDRIMESAERQKAIALDLFDTRMKLERQFVVGARASLREYSDAAANAAANAANVFGNAMHSIEDAFVNAASKGKEAFKDMVNAILADIARMIIRMKVTGPIGEAIARAIGGGAGGGEEELIQLAGPGGPPAPRAFGGPVSMGSAYLVGEMGPELFVPSMSGSIVSSGDLGGITVVNNNYIDSRTDQASIALMMKATEDRTVAKIRQMQQRTGDPRV